MKGDRLTLTVRDLLVLKLVLAFCSLVYELVLAQTLAAFLQNTVLRYSVTVGLYMFSLGFGALLAEGRMTRHPVTSLMAVELGLTALGAGAVPLLFALDAAGLPEGVFSFGAHALVIVIGLLSGTELPLLLHMTGEDGPVTEGRVLAADYAGAFMATVAFAFLFFPRLGLIPTALTIAALNAAAGVYLFRRARPEPGEGQARLRAALGATQIGLGLAVAVGLVFSGKIVELLLQSFLS